MKIVNRNNIILFLQSLPIIWLFSGFFITVDAVNIIIPLTLLCLITQFFKPESNISYIPNFLLITILGLTLHIVVSDRIHDASTQEIRGYIIALVMLFVVVTPEKILEKKHWLLLTASICSLLYCFYFSIYMPTSRSEWSINAIPYSTMTTLVASISLILAIYTPKHNLINWLSFLFSLIAIVLSESRGPILALICSSFIILIPLIKRHKFSYKLIIPILILAFAGSYLLSPLLADRYQQTKNEINLIVKGQYSSSIGIRLDLWKVAIQTIKEKPIAGMGRDLRGQMDALYKDGEISKATYRFNASHYHNQYLDAWAKNGLLFFLLILGLLLYPIYYYLKNKNTTTFISCNISIVYIVTSLTDVPLHTAYGIILYIFLQCLLLSNDKEIKNYLTSNLSNIYRPLKPRNIRNFYYAYVKYGSIQLLTSCHFTTKNKKGTQIQYFWKMGTIFPHPIGIVIGKNVSLGYNCKIFQNVTIGEGKTGYPVIGNNVVIYANSIVFNNIYIADNAIIPPNSIVNRNVEEYEIYRN